MGKAPDKEKASGKGSGEKGGGGKDKAGGHTLHAPLRDDSRKGASGRHGRDDDLRAGDPSAVPHVHKRKKPAFVRQLTTVLAVPLLLLLLVGVYMFVWFSAAGKARSLVEALEQQHDPENWQVSAGDIAMTGFPLAVRLQVPNVSVTAPARWGGWTWRAEKVELSVMPWRPMRPELVPQGPHEVQMADGSRYRLGGTPVSLRASLDSSAQVTALSLAADGLTVQPLPPLGGTGSGGALSPVTFGKASAQGTLLDPPAPVDVKTASASFALHLADVSLPSAMMTPVGPTLGKLDVEARLLGPLGDGSLREKLTRWRDDGGTVEVDSLFIDWKPLKLAAAGTLALDDRLQPVGALSTQTQGFFDAVHQMEASGVVRSRDATMARVVLATMSSLKDGVPTLNAPLNLQGGAVTVGPATLFELPVIAWPGPVQPRELPLMRPNYEVDRWGQISRQK